MISTHNSTSTNSNQMKSFNIYILVSGLELRSPLDFKNEWTLFYHVLEDWNRWSSVCNNLKTTSMISFPRWNISKNWGTKIQTIHLITEARKSHLKVFLFYLPIETGNQDSHNFKDCKFGYKVSPFLNINFIMLLKIPYKKPDFIRERAICIPLSLKEAFCKGSLFANGHIWVHPSPILFLRYKLILKLQLTF
jgi:hypothetical protein